MTFRKYCVDITARSAHCEMRGVRQAETWKPSAISIASKVISDEVTDPLTDAGGIISPGNCCCANDAFFSCWVLWKAMLEEVHGVFPPLLFILESSTEVRCKTFQLGVEFCIGTFNQSLNSTGIWGSTSNAGVISILPLLATREGADVSHLCIYLTVLFLAPAFWASWILAFWESKAFAPWYFIDLRNYL